MQHLRKCKFHTKFEVWVHGLAPREGYICLQKQAKEFLLPHIEQARGEADCKPDCKLGKNTSQEPKLT